MQTTSTTRPNDPIAMLVVYGLLALMLYAGVKAFDRAPDPAQAQGPIIIATPALPTAVPTDAPAFVLAAPTPAPAPTDAPIEPIAPAPALASQDGPGEAIAPPAEYLDVVGAQAPHSPRGDVADPPASYEAGPILYPDQGIVIDPSGVNAPEAGIAVAVPAISAEQAAIIGARQSATCPDGQTFYPRTGCHLEGSGGPQPGAVGEARP